MLRKIVLETCNTGVAIKTINSGFALSQASPFVLNALYERTFLKIEGAFRLQVNNLFNQADNLSRVLTNNMITETRTNQVGRYFLATFRYRLDKFR